MISPHWQDTFIFLGVQENEFEWLPWVSLDTSVLSSPELRFKKGLVETVQIVKLQPKIT